MKHIIASLGIFVISTCFQGCSTRQPAPAPKAPVKLGDEMTDDSSSESEKEREDRKRQSSEEKMEEGY